MMSHFAIV